LTTFAIIGLLMAGWIAVQTAWRKRFPEMLTDDDVLANRRSCQGCNCSTRCENNPYK
jgi:hypothetical protein